MKILVYKAAQKTFKRRSKRWQVVGMGSTEESLGPVLFPKCQCLACAGQLIATYLVNYRLRAPAGGCAGYVCPQNIGPAGQALDASVTRDLARGHQDSSNAKCRE